MWCSRLRMLWKITSSTCRHAPPGLDRLLHAPAEGVKVQQPVGAAVRAGRVAAWHWRPGPCGGQLQQVLRGQRHHGAAQAGTAHAALLLLVPAGGAGQRSMMISTWMALCRSSSAQVLCAHPKLVAVASSCTFCHMCACAAQGCRSCIASFTLTGPQPGPLTFWLPLQRTPWPPPPGPAAPHHPAPLDGPPPQGPRQT